MDDLYREQILDHYKNPRNFGELDNPSVTSSDNLVSCGDQLSMQLLFDKEKKIVKDVRFQGTGCAISMASASMLTEKVKGAQVNDLQSLTKNDILKMIGVNPTPTRLKCALLSLEVLYKALSQIK